MRFLRRPNLARQDRLGTSRLDLRRVRRPPRAVLVAMLIAAASAGALAAGPIAASGRTGPGDWRSHSASIANQHVGHEHGSDRSSFAGRQEVRRQGFSRVAHRLGRVEPHEGFKVFVVNNDGRGKAWMVTVHQGTSGPRRASQRHHSLEVVMVRLRDRKVLARVQLMADFGEAILDCQGQVPQSSARVLPTLAPGCASDYEVWTTQASVGDGRFQAAGISFGVDNRRRSSTRPIPHGWSSTMPAYAGLAIRRGRSLAVRGTDAGSSTRGGWSATTARLSSTPTYTGAATRPRRSQARSGSTSRMTSTWTNAATGRVLRRSSGWVALPTGASSGRGSAPPHRASTPPGPCAGQTRAHPVPADCHRLRPRHPVSPSQQVWDRSNSLEAGAVCR